MGPDALHRAAASVQGEIFSLWQHACLVRLHQGRPHTCLRQLVCQLALHQLSGRHARVREARRAVWASQRACAAGPEAWRMPTRRDLGDATRERRFSPAASRADCGRRAIPGQHVRGCLPGAGRAGRAAAAAWRRHHGRRHGAVVLARLELLPLHQRRASVHALLIRRTRLRPPHRRDHLWPPGLCRVGHRRWRSGPVLVPRLLLLLPLPRAEAARGVAANGAGPRLRRRHLAPAARLRHAALLCRKARGRRRLWLDGRRRRRRCRPGRPRSRRAALSSGACDGRRRDALAVESGRLCAVRHPDDRADGHRGGHLRALLRLF